MQKRFLALILMCLMLLPAAAMAAGVAKIGATEYNTLDEAIKAVTDGGTITVLADCTTDGINLNKNMTIQGAGGKNKPTITFNKYGIALWQKELTFKDLDIVMNKVTSTPYTAEWGWMTICAQTNSTLNLYNVDMLMDGDPEKTGKRMNKHAIYFCGTDELNMVNSNLTIKNYVQDALEWDGAQPGYNGDDPSKYNVNLDNSTFLSDHNRSGFTGTFFVTTKNSKVDVIHSSGNGSNGSHFDFTDSIVNFSDNGSHGISATTLKATRSPITTNNNGRHGVYSSLSCELDNTTIRASSNGYNGLRVGTRNYGGMCQLHGHKADIELLNNGYNKIDFDENGNFSGFLISNVEGNFDEDCKLVIRGSANNGMRVDDQYTTFEIQDGAKVEIMKNHSDSNGGNGAGGGVRVVGGQLTLPKNAKLYNNHATDAGDDIYVTSRSGVMGSLLFGKTGADWALDGAPDCQHAIDGWYDDTDPAAKGARWNVHDKTKPIHAVRVSVPSALKKGPLALKAAHGVPADPNLPQTGDNSSLTMLMMLSAVSLCAAVVIMKKKHNVTD